MVRPVSFKGFQKGFQGVSLRGFRGFQIFLWELCVCIKYLRLGDPAAGSGNFLTESYLCLRKMENESIDLLQHGQIVMGAAHNPIKVIYRAVLRHRNKRLCRDGCKDGAVDCGKPNDEADRRYCAYGA